LLNAQFVIMNCNTVLFVLVVLLPSAVVCQIAIRGRLSGVQMYDPLRSPHAWQVDKPDKINANAYGGHAVMPSHRRDIAYFADDDGHFAIYDVRTNKHRLVMPMRMKLMWFGMTNIHEDVLVCGGISEDKWPPPVNATDTCEIFITDSWLPYPSMPMPMYSHTMVTIHGRPYVFGGRTNKVDAVNMVHMFTMGKWTSGAHMPVARFGSSSLAFEDPMGAFAVVCGGQDYVDGKDAQHAECMAYSTSNDEWLMMKKWSLNEKRASHGMTVYRGRVYVYGGNQGLALTIKVLNSVEMLDTEHGWQMMPHPLFVGDWWFQTIVIE